MNTIRFYSLSRYMRLHYQKRVQKVPLDAGFSCPNRDGSLSSSGCIFCNPQGSGTGWAAQGISLQEQYLKWSEILQRKYKARYFWAYLQSYSNTYAPVHKLASTLQELKDLPGLVGICVGTRPDCVDMQKLELLARLELQDVWLELGLQSAQERTLALINRGHGSREFVEACNLASELGLKVCGHLVLGLPGESLQDVQESVRFVNRLPVQGVKLHNLYVCKNTTLASWWRQGDYQPLQQETYVEWLSQAIALLRSDIVLHRITGDPAPGELLAPDWARNKQDTLQSLQQKLSEADLWQGKHWDAAWRLPHWLQA
ncbi:MAG: TIGR01212 family radical SAM protein [Thermodesulfobacteriota bacterium]